MRISHEKLIEESRTSGFRPEMLEKAVHLLNLLEAINSHPFLKGKFALKGGTALNLFLFDIPRLSVDIDLNYIASGDREIMLTERPDLERALISVFERGDFIVKSTSGDEHAGGKWRLGYLSSAGAGGNLEVDLNYLIRTPLWPVQSLDSHLIGSWQAREIPVMDVHELAAGKITALLTRHKARDLYDCRELFGSGLLNLVKLRVAFTVYGAMSRKDWRTVSVEDVNFDPKELANELIPVLREGAIKIAGDASEYGRKLVDDVRIGLSGILPLIEAEVDFLNLLLDSGEINSSLLTSDAELQARITHHPGLLWKALNVKEWRKLNPGHE
jgi:hypothetical protein